jgi:RNA polymerase sigma-70 factor (ECF subfamily)
MDYNNKNNEELMMIYRDAEPISAYSAFEILYHRTSNSLYSFLIKRTKSVEEAQDMLQKVYFKIHQSKELFNEKYKFEQWLFTIAKNLLLDDWRKKTREAKKIAAYIKESSGESYPEKMLPNDLIERIVTDSNELEILELKYVDELSYAEISKILSKSEVSLRKMVSRIIKRISNEG